MTSFNRSKQPAIDLPPITIRTKKYKIFRGDYIMYNGRCFMFHSGDQRTLRWDESGFTFYKYVELTKRALAQINFEKLHFKSTEDENGCVYWFFLNPIVTK